MRYFQHLNPQDPDFQKVTTLNEIDNTDPSFVLYYFADGSKCNKDFIAELNDMNAFGTKEFAEVSDMNNIWSFDIHTISREDAKPRYTTTQTGERVEIPSLMNYTNSEAKTGTKINIKNKPEFISPEVVKALNKEDKLAKQSLNFNMPTQTTSTTKSEELAKPTIDIEKTNISDVVNITRFDVDKLGSTIEFVYNGKSYSMDKNEFFKNAIMKPEEKITEKIVEKEVIVNKVVDDHIDTGLNDEQKKLVDNMIDMAQKEECDISMDITLTLPPISVYQLIKSVYPKGMAEGFVNIIADRMQIKELKTAVAQGLLSYYDEDAEVEIENKENIVLTDPITEFTQEEVSKKKAGRPKKA